MVISAVSVSADNYAKYNLLKDDRAAGRLVFPPTTLAQKKVILSNVENALTVSIILLMITPAGPILHHTAASMATTEVEFTFIEGDADIAKNPTVVVTSTSETPRYSLPSLERITPRSELEMNLLAINGLTFVRVVRANQFKYGFGANEFGGQRSALEYLLRYMGKSTVCQVKTLSLSSLNPELTLRPSILSLSRMSLDATRTVGILGANCTRASLVKLFPEHLKRACLLAQSSLNIVKSQTPYTPPRGHEMDNSEDHKRGADMGEMSSSSQKSAVLMNPTGVTKIRWGI
ncbi:hypothetical protein BASA83_005152 [Batrachochytrium salamandrivorans]|nr:hypothetical protein BASA83_005152 [Batrachochytrium salamandrivorans]